MIHRLLLITFVAVFSIPFAFADDGGSSSGGTTFSKDTERTLDSSTFEVPFNPRQEFSSLLNQRTYPLLQILRSKLPVLATELDQVFSKRLWWKTSQTLIGREADSRIQARQQLVIDQDKTTVLVSSSFWRKKPEEQNTSLIHEAVRFLAMEKKLTLSDSSIQLITRMIEHAGTFKNGEALRDTLHQAGLGYYLTREETAPGITNLNEVVELCTKLKKDISGRKISPELMERASRLALAARDFEGKYGKNSDLQIRPNVFWWRVAYELAPRINAIDQCFKNSKSDWCAKLSTELAAIEIHCGQAKDLENRTNAFENSESLHETGLVLGTVLENKKFVDNPASAAVKVSEKQKKQVKTAAPQVPGTDSESGKTKRAQSEDVGL